MLRLSVLALCFSAGCLFSETLLVLNKTDGTASFIDIASGKTTATVPVGEGPHEVAVSEDGRWAVVTNYGARTPGDSLSVIDVAGRKEARRVSVAPLRRPHGIVFHAGKAFFTAETNKAVASYDPAADKLDWLLGTGQSGTHMLAISPDGRTLWTTDMGSGTVSAIVLSGSHESVQIAAGDGPEGFDFTPNGRELWAAHSRDPRVTVIDTATRKATGTIDIGAKRSNRLKFTRDGKLALVSDLEGGELIVVDAASRKVVKRLALGKAPEGILIAPDGKRAFVAVAGEDHIAVIDLEKLERVGRIATGRAPDGMALLP